MKLLCVHALEKVFPNVEPTLLLERATAFKNERYGFQFAVYTDADVTVKVALSVGGKEIPARLVKSMPSQKSNYLGVADDFVFFTERANTYYPDLLQPITGEILLKRETWNSIWGTLLCEELPLGKNEVVCTLTVGEETLTSRFILTVLDKKLPACDIPNTEWFHYDCLSDYYGEEVFSPRYNEIIGKYFENMVAHGINTLYVPMFTFATNTEVGKYRKTVQLVDVEVKNGEYFFDFTRLLDFMKRAQNYGFEYFEMGHMATQWGARYTPKIYATVDGKRKRIFGWDKKSTSKEYLRFLDGFLPEIVKTLNKNGFAGKCFFHISDEPKYAFINEYKTVALKFKEHLGDYKIIDALSNYSFYGEGLVDLPVASTDAVAPFFENNVPIWLYYCCAQGGEYFSNRFFNMPLMRTRILGLQLFANDIKGFLHWGYNFYYTNLSQRLIDPYFVTDAGNVYPSGDSFLVYPAADGSPYDSLRNEAFCDAFQDYRALLLLSQTKGREFVKTLLQEEGVRGVSEYPRDSRWLIAFRERLNALIMQS